MFPIHQKNLLEWDLTLFEILAILSYAAFKRSAVKQEHLKSHEN